MGLIDQMAACGFNSFFPTVVKTLGFSTTVTLVMTCPYVIHTIKSANTDM
jgi:hypothetical protein